MKEKLAGPTSDQDLTGLKKVKRIQPRPQQKNSIKTLMINGVECSDPIIMAKEISAFYQNLYSSSFSVNDSDCFFGESKIYSTN